jgi:hypothetical protein
MAAPLGPDEAICVDCKTFLSASTYKALCSPCGRVAFCEDCVVDHATWHRETEAEETTRNEEAARWSTLSTEQKRTELVSNRDTTLVKEAMCQRNDLALAVSMHEQELDAEQQRHAEELARIDTRKWNKLESITNRFVCECDKAIVTFDDEMVKLPSK